MAGALLSVGVVLVLATTGGGMAAVGGAYVAAQRATAAADAAALAAADVASAALPAPDGAAEPCDAARLVARAHGAEVAVCRLDGVTATVAVSLRFAMLPVSRSARAGPPPGS